MPHHPKTLLESLRLAEISKRGGHEAELHAALASRGAFSRTLCGPLNLQFKQGALEDLIEARRADET